MATVEYTEVDVHDAIETATAQGARVHGYVFSQHFQETASTVSGTSKGKAKAAVVRAVQQSQTFMSNPTFGTETAALVSLHDLHYIPKLIRRRNTHTTVRHLYLAVLQYRTSGTSQSLKCLL